MVVTDRIGAIMTMKIHGTSSANQVLTADLQQYVCYAKSPGAFTSPNPNPPANEELIRLVNIQVTNQVYDQSQKNFEVLLMAIGLRAMPVILGDPAPVIELSTYTTQLSGEGFVWKFAVERGVQFQNFTPYGSPGPVGLLVDDLEGLPLPSGVRVTTIQGSPTGWAQNIAFYKVDGF